MRRTPTVPKVAALHTKPVGGVPDDRASYLTVLGLLVSSHQAPSPPRSLERIASRPEFDALSRVYYQGRFYALPHLMFVIDRANHGTVYYVNSKRYAFHTEFVNANYLTLERGQEFFTHNYVEANRRFLLGTINHHERSDKFSFDSGREIS